MHATIATMLLACSASASWVQPPTARIARAVAPRRACHAVASDAVVEAEAPAGEKFEFEAEVTKVMDIIINSLYSDKVRPP